MQVKRCDPEGNIIRLIRGTELLASDAENARTYYHYASDELGSTTHVADDREVLNRYEYDVWGNLAVCEETVPNRFLYTGQQQDPITRQYYLRARYYNLRARYYNPVIARFTQKDTYRGDGLNLYAYCRNNPVCHVDPSGHCSKDPNGDFMPPAVVPEGKQLPAVYVPQQEALRRWYANFQDDAGTAGRAGSVGSGDFMPPAVIPKQPLPSMDLLQPSLMPEPPKQLPAVIYPLPQELLDGNPQNRVSGPVADVPNSGNRVSSGGTETYYRTMSQSDYDQLMTTRKIPPTKETFVSPTETFSSEYNGVMVEFELNSGTTESLLEIAVGNNSRQAVKDYGILPQVTRGWTENHAFFKGEGTQTNIGLGRGKALEIFNNNIVNFKVIGGK